VKVTILKSPTEEDWLFCKRCALTTIGKAPKTPPSEEWKRKILRARHSPIRELRFAFLLEDIPYWVSVHLCRHVHAQPYVKSQRNDRQSQYDRGKAPQDAPVSMIWTMNAEEWLTICNKRLCNQASKETREVIEMIRDAVEETNPEFIDEMVPMCVREGECHEMYPCGGCG
jgi:thymidylate synthase ThyX